MIWLQLASILLLVLLNGFFVAAEFALVSVRRSRIDQLANEGNRQAKGVQKALHHLDTYIAATQLGITMASIALGYIGEPALAHLLQPLFAKWLPPTGSWITAHGVAVGMGFAIVTALHIVLGELAPKSVALQRPELTTMWVTAPLDLFLRIFRPFIRALNATGNGVVRLMGLNPVADHMSVHSVEELEILLHSSREAGLIQEQQEQMVAGVFDFESTPVRRLMTPRLDIVAVEGSAPLTDLLERAKETGHSRVLIYEGELDNLVGVAHIKDALHTALTEDRRSLSRLKARLFARPVHSIPESKRAGYLLSEFRRTKSQIAVVRDEFGTLVGVVTVEDLLEEIVGEIQDEYDAESPPIRALNDREFLVDAMMPAEDFALRFQLEISPEDGDTVGGVVFTQIGHQPQKGERVSIQGHLLTVEETDGRRIQTVRLELPAGDSHELADQNL